jgi:predicted nucleic acid-binding protein
MADLAAAIPRGALVGIDTVTFIYHLELAPTYRGIVRPFFTALERGTFQAVTSVMTLLEIAVRPLQLQRPDIADDYELLLLEYPNLRVCGIDSEIARRAAELRAQYRVDVADSLQLATALKAGASLFVTNDRRLARVSGIGVLLLDTFRGSP